jgi:hypothetical protein
MRAAIEAFDTGANVGVVTKLHPTRSHSGAAEGGINAALGNAAEDSPETHAYDTVKGSDYLGDQDAIEVLASEAPGDIYQLEHWGCVFSRNDEGKLAQRPFGAAGSPRTVYSADITGHVLIHVLYEQLMKRMEQGPMQVYEEYFAWRLVIEDGRCVGVICWDLVHGGLKLVTGKSIVLATGGMGRIYRATTNAYACNGDGMAIHQQLFVDDAALGFAGVLGKARCIGQTYNLVNRGFISWADYHRTAMRVIGREVELVGVPLADLVALDVPNVGICKEIFAHNTYYSCEKIMRDVPEFRPQVSLEEAMRRVLESMDRDGRVPNSDEETWEDRIIGLQRSVSQTAV